MKEEVSTRARQRGCLELCTRNVDQLTRRQKDSQAFVIHKEEGLVVDNGPPT